MTSRLSGSLTFISRKKASETSGEEERAISLISMFWVGETSHKAHREVSVSITKDRLLTKRILGFLCFPDEERFENTAMLC